MRIAGVLTAAAMTVSGIISGTNLALADAAWPDLRDMLYDTQPLFESEHVIALDAPYRTFDDARTRIAASITAPQGRMIESVTVILDENPMPVSAVFDLREAQASFAFETTMRINGPTQIHVVAQTTDGQLFVHEAFVKTSGSGACAAPPGTDVEEALASLGRMDLSIETSQAATTLASLTAGRADRLLNIALSHPSHSGMQMDQISLLYIPVRYVETLDVEVDGKPFVTVTGSISLSENPSLSVSVPATTRTAGVTMTDTSGSVTQAHIAAVGL